MKINTREDLSVGDMTKEMLDRKPLPIGKTQFIEWSDRIIAGAMVGATHESQRFALAAMLMHIGPTEAFREDAFFILQLRKSAVNETAHAMMTELKEEQENKRKQAEATAPILGVVSDGGVLENQSISNTI